MNKIKLPVYSTVDYSTGSSVDITENILNKSDNVELIAQYKRVYETNQRAGNAHTKTRGEVAGTGKKPYRQKGTGRARAGSRRSPLWVGGGVTHGPRSKFFRLELPKKMRIGALLTALSSRFKDNKISVLDQYENIGEKTKNFATVLERLSINKLNNVLVITSDKNTRVLKGFSNLKNVNVRMVKNLSAYDVIKSSSIIFDSNSIRSLDEKYSAKE
jgi:large subunit ribosomal protein L4